MISDKLYYIIGWFNILRNRGKVFRKRDIIFHNWSKWAPKKHRLKIAKQNIIKWINEKKIRHYFNNMLEICHLTIAKRMTGIRIMNDRINDRKLLICCYALTNLPGQMMMLGMYVCFYSFVCSVCLFVCLFVCLIV